ncbi:28S ribosomal protein S22, mitochondrial-like [Actinia tenebrosa]|uniref:28S ribosomal protein S22, mitochondrial-like n=1 Tax=Actinia tenebrosa TaxID=6105 RepID=A0A6P8HW69_ACTTE|nr:28S ribosomal protein S22, mitochondrial-like [Actinia tenebrosa]
MAAALTSRFYRFFSINSLPIRAISTSKAHFTGGKILSFDDERVRAILKRLTGCEVEKVLSRRPQDVSVPTYKIMTNEELLEAEKETKARAEELLDMPPVMEERQEIDEVIDIDERLSGYDTANYVFTDISTSVDDRTRRIVVREPSGRLRAATWAERDASNFIYFPKEGRKWETPEMLTESGIQVPLSQNRHEDILDLVCVQFEPDTADYIRVHDTIYDNINKENKFELLWSTRHFGGLVYYLMKHKNLGNLLDYFTENEYFDEAVDLINFHHLVYPDHVTATQAKSSKLSGIQMLRAYLKREGPLSSLQTVEEQFFKDNNSSKSGLSS